MSDQRTETTAITINMNPSLFCDLVFMIIFTVKAWNRKQNDENF